ncbi:hypothetical protein DX888_19930 [Vibrio alginolyticus]|nr:hypothetical protein [Vibrio alginolyticus]EGR2552916.1 hypothetical protein [Vibrio alginolyticus]QCO86499.1 hypothetical protein D3H41_10580 [Vibrio neocaledonicus]
MVKMESRARILAIKRQKKRQLCATASDSFSLKNVNHKTHFLTQQRSVFFSMNDVVYIYITTEFVAVI